MLAAKFERSYWLPLFVVELPDMPLEPPPDAPAPEVPLVLFQVPVALPVPLVPLVPLLPALPLEPELPPVFELPAPCEPVDEPLPVAPSMPLEVVPEVTELPLVLPASLPPVELQAAMLIAISAPIITL